MFWTRRWQAADPGRLGRWGERRAERFLRGKGMATLARNARFRLGEIDLVMADPDGAIVFVEVKTRLDEAFQPVETVITQTKRGRMRNAVRCFLAAHPLQDRPFRCDVVVVVMGSRGRTQIRHYERVFVP